MADTLEFKAELKQLLHLITHSLYSDRDIFLRELVSNASDAINKIRHNALDNAEQLEGNLDWAIRLTPDAEAGTLTISDNGIGMTREEVIDHLGTVAKSGTKAFLEAVKSQKEAANTPGLIGQFGVGFYSAFMVADEVSVITRPAGANAGATKWTSDGQGTFTVEPATRDARGSDIILKLKEDAKHYAEPWTLKALVRKFSDFVEHPILLKDKEKNEDETLNNRKAIWLRPKNEVTAEEYTEFYKQLSHDDEGPGKVLHFSIEGATEFKGLVFIPKVRPSMYDWEEAKAGLRLYVQRVLIMERCEAVLPIWLRFVKGVVDSSGLPLNVSREILQNNPHLEVIQKTVVRNVISGLDEMKRNDAENYRKFYAGFGAIIKEGLTRDWQNREKVADLLLFESANTKVGETTTLAEYVGKMPEDQKEIVYLTGENAQQLRRSPYLEAYQAKGQDVLLMTDPIDEFAFPSLEYKGKRFIAADKSNSNDADVPEAVKTQYAGLITAMKTSLPNVSEIRLTKRLTDSATCLVAGDGGMTAHMERLMKKYGEAVPESKRVLELNPDHATIKALQELNDKHPGDPRIESFSQLLYDQAVVAEGSRVADPVAFGKRLNELIIKAAS